MALGLVGLAACAGKRPPTADDPKPPPPALVGQAVMLLPAQTDGALPGLDAEIAYWLKESAPRTRWVERSAMQRVIDRSPDWSLNLDALAVARFRRAEMQQIGEPLYTDLRRLGALLDVRLALVPVAAGFVPLMDEGEETPARGRVEIAVAIIDTLGGRVLWYGVVAGEAGTAPDRQRVASAARALARTLAP